MVGDTDDVDQVHLVSTLALVPAVGVIRDGINSGESPTHMLQSFIGHHTGTARCNKV